MPVLAGKSPPPPALISRTGTTVQTHQASSCSSLAPSQIQVFHGGTTKEASTTFEVWAKQLTKLLSGKVYLGGSAGATKGKWKWSHPHCSPWGRCGWWQASLSVPPPRSKHHSSPSTAVQAVLRPGFSYDYTWVTTCNCLPPSPNHLCDCLLHR